MLKSERATKFWVGHLTLTLPFTGKFLNRTANHSSIPPSHSSPEPGGENWEATGPHFKLAITSCRRCAPEEGKKFFKEGDRSTCGKRVRFELTLFSGYITLFVKIMLTSVWQKEPQVIRLCSDHLSLRDCVLKDTFSFPIVIVIASEVRITGYTTVRKGCPTSTLNLGAEQERYLRCLLDSSNLEWDIKGPSVDSSDYHLLLPP